MISFAKPVLTGDLYVAQKEEFSITCYMCDTYTWRKVKHIHKTPIFLSQRMLRKDYDDKGSGAEETSGRKPQGAKTNWLAINRQS
jgi:hypothetical protein